MRTCYFHRNNVMFRTSGFDNIIIKTAKRLLGNNCNKIQNFDANLVFRSHLVLIILCLVDLKNSDH